MKLVKKEVEEFTEEALAIGGLALASLKMSGCPLPEIYEMVEDFIIHVDKHRNSLELEPIAPPEIHYKPFSKKIAKMVASGGIKGNALELTTEQASKLTALLESFKAANEKGTGKEKRPIGFSLEDVDFDPKKVN